MAERKTAKVQTTEIDYLKWRGDLSFAADPFNEVDNLVLCTIAYLNFSRFPQLETKDPKKAVRLAEIAAKMDERDDQMGLSEHSYLPVMRAAAKSARFRQVKMFGYVNELDTEQESQFHAISFLLPTNLLFVAFMGTDKSLAGWKENFNLSFLACVPAQKRAQDYAAEMATICADRKLLIGGHSKGGNLAAWATIHLPQEIQDKQLLQAYNNDGPGFTHDLLSSEAYKRVEERLLTFIPQESIVGVLLDHEEDYFVVDSINRGMLQHDIISWGCIGNRMAYLKKRSKFGQSSDEVVHQWIGSMTETEREEFSDALFTVLSANGKYQTIQEVMAGGISGTWDRIRCFSAVDPEKRKLLLDVFHRLGVDVKDEVRRDAGQNLQNVKEHLKTTFENLTEKIK